MEEDVRDRRSESQWWHTENNCSVLVRLRTRRKLHWRQKGIFFFFCDSEMTDEDREIVFNTQAEHTPSSNSKTSSLVDLMISARQELQNTKPIPMMPPLYVKTLGGCQLHSGRRHSKLLRRCMH